MTETEQKIFDYIKETERKLAALESGNIKELSEENRVKIPINAEYEKIRLKYSATVQERKNQVMLIQNQINEVEKKLSDREKRLSELRAVRTPSGLMTYEESQERQRIVNEVRLLTNELEGLKMEKSEVNINKNSINKIFR